MSKIGIKSLSGLNLATGLNLKRDLLIFDKIIVEKEAILAEEQKELGELYLLFSSQIQNKEYELFRQFNMNEIEFLTKEKVLEIVEGPELFANDNIKVKYEPVYEQFRLSERHLHQTIADLNSKLDNPEPILTQHDIEYLGHITGNHYCRLLWVDALIKGYTNHFPILNDVDFFQPPSSDLSKELVFEVILKNMPVPSDDTSWEQIFDFKNDSEVRAKYDNLIHWVNNVSKEKMALDEFEDYYRHLYSEYLQEFKRYDIKHRRSLLRLILVGTGALIDNVARFNYEKIATSICDFVEQNTELPHLEKDFRGRELAYIRSVNEQFST